MVWLGWNASSHDFCPAQLVSYSSQIPGYNKDEKSEGLFRQTSSNSRFSRLYISISVLKNIPLIDLKLCFLLTHRSSKRLFFFMRNKFVVFCIKLHSLFVVGVIKMYSEVCNLYEIHHKIIFDTNFFHPCPNKQHCCLSTYFVIHLSILIYVDNKLYRLMNIKLYRIIHDWSDLKYPNYLNKTKISRSRRKPNLKRIESLMAQTNILSWLW